MSKRKVLIVEDEQPIVEILKFNGMNIEVKQYLPINDKLRLIGDVINLSADENNFSNPVKIDMFTVIEIIEYYTNINFTEKQREDYAKLYDLIFGSGCGSNSRVSSRKVN